MKREIIKFKYNFPTRIFEAGKKKLLESQLITSVK